MPFCQLGFSSASLLLALPRLVAPFLQRWARVQMQHLANHARAAHQELNPSRRHRARQHRGPGYHRRIIRHDARR